MDSRTISPSVEGFMQAIKRAGMEPPTEIITDGQIHRYFQDGDKPWTQNGWYVFYEGDPSAGAFGCWKRDIAETWCSKDYRLLTSEGKKQYQKRMELIRKQREEEQARVHAQCRTWCADTWQKAKNANDDHPYLKKKGIKSYGLKTYHDSLIIPLKDMTEVIHGVQFIAPDGSKKFKTGTSKAGHFFKIGKSKEITVIVCEGYATGASIYEATSHAVVIAFDAGNLLPVAQGIRTKFPDIKIIIAADNDQWTEGNPGTSKATMAAREVGALLAIPEFKNIDTKPTDFNDLHCAEGLEAVKLSIASAEPTMETAKCAKLLEMEQQNGIVTSDMANAVRFAKQHRGTVLYTPEKGWFVWDGKKWTADNALIMQKAKETAKSIFREIEASSSDKQNELFKWARQSQDSRRLNAMLYLAQSEIGIPARLTDFDSDPWRLNVENGIINLQTGELEIHNPDRLCCRLVQIKFDSSARCDLWLSFLYRIMDGNKRQIEYLQRAIGYSLTGNTGEQCLFFLIGIGANGKSVFLFIMSELCSNYGMNSGIETFTLRQSSGIPNDIARLAGARLVAVSETADGQRLHEPLIKDLTGGDLITARFLHHEFFEFRPQFKIWIRGNHKPVIKGTDHGIWRRIHLVPFSVTIPEAEQDQSLPEKLKMELPGILNWAVQGCLEWQKTGLRPPDEVRTAVQEYRAEMDILGAFLAECCLEGSSFRVSANALFSAYRTWADKSGEHQINQRRFGTAMTERGFERKRQRDGYLYLGIGLCVNDVNDREPIPDFKPLRAHAEEKNLKECSQGTNRSQDLGKCSPCGRVSWCQVPMREFCRGPFDADIKRSQANERARI